MERQTIEQMFHEIDVMFTRGERPKRVKKLLSDWLDQEAQIAVREALQTVNDEAWLVYHDGITKSNTHGHKQINIGADNIRIDPVSILSLEQQILTKLRKESK